MKIDAIMALQERGIQPSAQRVAVAQVVLSSEEHPSADQVFQAARARYPQISRATVYNTLNLLVARGLLRQLELHEGAVVFDPNLVPHHHFIDETTGSIQDIPWDAVKVTQLDKLKGYEVHEYQVVMRGKRARR